MFDDIIEFIRSLYHGFDSVHLHQPCFIGNEKKYIADAVDSTYVSSVGGYVDRFEREIASFVGVKHAVATVNGTAALHIALLLAGVQDNDEVITQPLTFVATCNAIKYCGATPTFVDIDPATCGMSADSLKAYLQKNTRFLGGSCVNAKTGKPIRACLPMHTFGYPAEIDRIQMICDEYKIALVEDAAESLGSYYNNQHTGSFGRLGILSFNGNKIITCGGGGMILTNDEKLAKRAKHLTTTAKLPHSYRYHHDEVGYNYRMPNINAALGVGQLEKLPTFLEVKQSIADQYKQFFSNRPDVQYLEKPTQTMPNFWLNSILFNTQKERDEFIQIANQQKIHVRPAWELMSRLEMFATEQAYPCAESMADRLVNLPSYVCEKMLLSAQGRVRNDEKVMA